MVDSVNSPRGSRLEPPVHDDPVLTPRIGRENSHVASVLSGGEVSTRRYHRRGRYKRWQNVRTYTRLYYPQTNDRYARESRNRAAFNFNDDEDPQEVTIFDVQGLFERLTDTD